MIIVTDIESIKNYNKFILKLDRKMFYGYDGPEEEFEKWLKNSTWNTEPTKEVEQCLLRETNYRVILKSNR